MRLGRGFARPPSWSDPHGPAAIFTFEVTPNTHSNADSRFFSAASERFCYSSFLAVFDNDQVPKIITKVSRIELEFIIYSS